MDMVNYSEYREDAIKWLNGNREFNRGIELMIKTGFRPNVIRILQRHGKKSPHAAERLLKHMRDFVDAWSSRISQEDTDETIGVFNGEEHSNEAEDEEKPSGILVDFDKTENFPPEIAEVIRKFHNAYVKKDILQKQMSEVGEENDEKSVAKRKNLSDEIDEMNSVMDELYPVYSTFVNSGEITEIKEKEVAPRRKDIERDAKDITTLSKSEMQKLRKSLATKLNRARNMLQYGQETKADKDNPIPEGDTRRVKYESKIERLAKRIQEIDTAIAKLA